MPLSKAQYVEQVAYEVNFESPPENVRRFIERLYDEGFAPWAAAKRVLEYLDLKQAYGSQSNG